MRPKSDRVQKSLYLSQRLLAEIERAAAENDRVVSKEIERRLWDTFEKDATDKILHGRV